MSLLPSRWWVSLTEAIPMGNGQDSLPSYLVFWVKCSPRSQLRHFVHRSKLSPTPGQHPSQLLVRDNLWPNESQYIVSATSSALTALSSCSVPRGRQPGPPRGSFVYLHVCASTSTIKRGRWTSRNLEPLASSYFYEKMMGKEEWVLERHSLLSVMQLWSS